MPLADVFSRRKVLMAALLAALYALALGAFLNLPDIGGSSEAREAHVASVIVEEGEWLLPRRAGLVPSKPPLYHWITALIAESLGRRVTPAVARLPSALAAAGVLFLVVLLAIQLSGQSKRPRGSEPLYIGLASALVLSSTYAFTVLALHAMVDMTYTFFVTLALYAVVRRCGPGEPGRSGEFGTQIGALDMLLFFTAAGAAVLGKGPLGAALPLLLGAAALWQCYGWKHTLRILGTPRPAWLVFLLIAAPWYVLAALHGGGEVWERQWAFENLRRLFGGEAIRSGPLWFYVPQFLRFALPWSLVLAAVLWMWRRNPGAYPSAYAAERRTKNLFLMLFAVGFVLFSLPAGKRHSYLLPLYPWLSVYLGWHLCDLYRCASNLWQTRVRRVMERLMKALPLLWLLVLLTFELLKIPSGFAHAALESARGALLPLAPRIEWCAFALLLAGLAAARLTERSVLAAALAGCFSLQLLMCMLIQLTLTVRNDIQGYRALALQIARLVPAGAPLTAVREERDDELFDPVLYYLNRPVRQWPLASPQAPKAGYVMVQNSWLMRHRDRLCARVRCEEVARLRRKIEFLRPLRHAPAVHEVEEVVLLRPAQP